MLIGLNLWECWICPPAAFSLLDHLRANRLDARRVVRPHILLFVRSARPSRGRMAGQAYLHIPVLIVV